jgi:hypothetical protein
MSMFSAPSTGGGGDLPLAEINDHYVIVRPIRFQADIMTKHGAANAINVNVADLTTGTHHLDVLWFGAISNSLNNRIGEFVLGKVALVKIDGGKTKWVLEDATSDANVVAAAEKWMASNPGVLTGTSITAPTEPAPAPAAGGLAASLI